MNRYAYCHFCDDIRLELGNKTTLVGIYGGEMHVAAFPTVLPKFCIAAFCAAMLSEKISSLKIRVASNGSILQEVSVEETQLLEIWNTIEAKSIPEDPILQVSIGFNFAIAPLVLEKETVIVVTVVADGEEIIAGKLRVKRADKTS